jgi:apolipoprotein N-acyltransferase
MVRCANNGVSAAVNPLGGTGHPDTGEPQELRDAAGSHLTRGWMLAEIDIPERPATSLYIAIGDSGVIGLGILGLIAGIGHRVSQRRASE